MRVCDGLFCWVVAVLIGNKLDIVRADGGKRQVSTEEAERLVHDLKLDGCMETSAKADVNVKESFAKIATQTYKTQKIYRAKRLGIQNASAASSSNGLNEMRKNCTIS